MIRHCFITGIMYITLLQASALPAAAAARIAVLPFEIYGDESSLSLKDIIARDLSTQLAADNRLEIVGQSRVSDVMGDRASLTFNEATLRTIAEKLDAPFLVLGSMTRIGTTMSLDTYIFHADSTEAFTKAFSEGKNLDALTREMATKVKTHILKVAPPPQEEAAIPKETIAAAPPEADLPAVPVKEDAIVEEAVESGAVGSPVTGVERPVPIPEPDADSRGEALASAPEPAAPSRESAPAMASLRRDDVAAEPAQGTAETDKKKDRKDKEGPLSSPFASSKPVKITSESLEADNKKNTVTFKGNVVAKQGDIVISADTMTVDYEKQGGINTVQAFGNVKMSQAERVATGSKIIFYNPEQKIVMTGNPKIWQGDNLISCEKITVLLEEDKIFFEGKVDSTIFPKNLQDEGKKDVKQVEAIPSGTEKPRATEEAPPQ